MIRVLIVCVLNIVLATNAYAYKIYDKYTFDLYLRDDVERCLIDQINIVTKIDNNKFNSDVYERMVDRTWAGTGNADENAEHYSQWIGYETEFYENGFTIRDEWVQIDNELIAAMDWDSDGNDDWIVYKHYTALQGHLWDATIYAVLNPAKKGPLKQVVIKKYTRKGQAYELLYYAPSPCVEFSVSEIESSLD